LACSQWRLLSPVRIVSRFWHAQSLANTFLQKWIPKQMHFLNLFAHFHLRSNIAKALCGFRNGSNKLH
jgi:hypothetical protein